MDKGRLESVESHAGRLITAIGGTDAYSSISEQLHSELDLLSQRYTTVRRIFYCVLTDDLQA